MKKLFLLLLFLTGLFADIKIISWQMPNEIEYSGIIKKKIENYFNRDDIEIFVLQNLKEKPNLNLNNKQFIFVDNKFSYKNNSYYGFVIDKKFIMAETFVYPDYNNVWKFPPVLLYIPLYNLSIINIQANTDYKLSKTLKNDPYYFAKNEIYDLKNVIEYFYRKNINLRNLIITGNFGVDPQIINELGFKALVDDKITIDNINYGNYTYNVVSFIDKFVVKVSIDKNIDISGEYYPILIEF